MPTKQKIEVIKVNTERPLYRPKKFPRMPIMYLELIENKDKIKAELVNKEYEPPKAILNFEDKEPDNEIKENFEKRNEGAPKQKYESDSEKDSDSENSDNDNTSYRESYKDSYKRSHKDSDSDDSDKEDSDDEKPSKKSYSHSDDDSENDSDNEMNQSTHKSSHNSNNSDSDDEHNFKSSKNDSGSESEPESVKNKAKKNNVSDEDDDDDDLSKKIKKLLQKDKEERSQSRSLNRSLNRSQTRNISLPQQNYVKAPPTLKQLKEKGEIKENIGQIFEPTRNEQEEEDLKREILFKFELLKKSYKDITIPEFSIHSDYNTMVKTYESCLRKVTLDSTVETYKQYLMAGFMIVEFGCSKLLKLDMSGFSQQQILSMNSYERLLVELGEKSYVPNSTNWPVELRLLFMILMNAGIFIITKMIMKKTGANLLGMFNNMNIQTQPTQEKKRKMKGPDINLDDIPDIQ